MCIRDSSWTPHSGLSLLYHRRTRQLDTPLRPFLVVSHEHKAAEHPTQAFPCCITGGQGSWTPHSDFSLLYHRRTRQLNTPLRPFLAVSQDKAAEHPTQAFPCCITGAQGSCTPHSGLSLLYHMSTRQLDTPLRPFLVVSQDKAAEHPTQAFPCCITGQGSWTPHSGLSLLYHRSTRQLHTPLRHFFTVSHAIGWCTNLVLRDMASELTVDNNSNNRFTALCLGLPE